MYSTNEKKVRKKYKSSGRTNRLKKFIYKLTFFFFSFLSFKVDNNSQNLMLFGLSQNLGSKYFCLIHERALHSNIKCISSAI